MVFESECISAGCSDRYILLQLVLFNVSYILHGITGGMWAGGEKVTALFCLLYAWILHICTFKKKKRKVYCKGIFILLCILSEMSQFGGYSGGNSTFSNHLPCDIICILFMQPPSAPRPNRTIVRWLVRWASASYLVVSQHSYMFSLHILSHVLKPLYNYLLGRGGSVFGSFGLFVLLSVCNSTQKNMNWFRWNFKFYGWVQGGKMHKWFYFGGKLGFLRWVNEQKTPL